MTHTMKLINPFNLDTSKYTLLQHAQHMLLIGLISVAFLETVLIGVETMYS